MSTAAIYSRVSTEDQARTGYSLGDQVNLCRQRLITEGHTDITEYIDDGYSGEFIDRPALSRLRDDLRAKLIKTVMVYDPDRLSRNLTNQLLIADEIDKYGAKLDFITGSYDASPEGRLFFSMRGAIAEFEKEKIRERSLRGKRAKVLSGKPIFSNVDPFGYHCNRETGQYEIRQDEAEIIKTMFRLYIEKCHSMMNLEYELKAMGIVNRKGAPFNRSVLHRMLSNEMYAGTKWTFKIYQKKIGQKKRKVLPREQSEWVSIPIPAIIDQETFNQVSAIRCRNKATAKRNMKGNYLLQGRIRCAACGHAMGAVTFPVQKSGRQYSYYICSAYKNGKECPNHRCVYLGELETLVWDEIVAMYKKTGGTKSPKSKINTTKLNAETKLKKLLARKTALLKWVSEGTIDLTDAEKDLQKISSEVTLAQTIISTPEQPELKSDVTTAQVLNARTFEEKRNIILRMNLIVKVKQLETGEIIYDISPEGNI